MIKISKSETSPKQQRLFLLLSTAILYVFAYKTIHQLAIFNFVSLYILLCSVLMLVSLIITFFWKISLHMIGVGGFLGLLFVLSFAQNPLAIQVLPYVILLAGIVGTSRLYLQAHSPIQIYAGFLVGLGMSTIFLFLFLI